MKSEGTKSDSYEAIIFSLADDIVWASWPERTDRVELGQYASVTYMMQNFLDQCGLGERMAANGVRKNRS
jgi:hypothetical protein